MTKRWSLHVYESFGIRLDSHRHLSYIKTMQGDAFHVVVRQWNTSWEVQLEVQIYVVGAYKTPEHSTVVCSTHKLYKVITVTTLLYLASELCAEPRGCQWWHRPPPKSDWLALFWCFIIDVGKITNIISCMQHICIHFSSCVVVEYLAWVIHQEYTLACTMTGQHSTLPDDVTVCCIKSWTGTNLPNVSLFMPSCSHCFDLILQPVDSLR